MGLGFDKKLISAGFFLHEKLGLLSFSKEQKSLVYKPFYFKRNLHRTVVVVSLILPTIKSVVSSIVFSTKHILVAITSVSMFSSEVSIPIFQTWMLKLFQLQVRKTPFTQATKDEKVFPLVVK